VATEDELDAAVDRGLARRLLTVGAIEAEIGRLGRRGRSGVGRMRRALRRRGMAGAPHPSVLESRALRLLRQFGIEPLGTEVRMGPDGRYRVDIVLAPDVIMEVDGFAYHFDPEQMVEDKRRRTQIRLSGTTVLEYTWRDIVYEPRRVISEVRQALAISAAAAATVR
jgi:very-short-patch-repair endonuclease